MRSSPGWREHAYSCQTLYAAFAMAEQKPLVPLNEEGRRCEDCGFDLRGLTRPHCPECGAAFDPNVMADPELRPIAHLRIWQNSALVGVAWFIFHLGAFRLFGIELPTIEVFTRFPTLIIDCFSPLAQFAFLAFALPMIFGVRRVEQRLGAGALILFYLCVVAQVVLTAVP